MDSKHVFGLKLRELRVSRGLTQEELAENIDRSVDALSKLERGVGFPSLDTLLALSRQFEIPTAKLLETFEQNRKRSAKRVALEAQLEALSSQLDDRQLGIAVEQIRILAQQS